MPIAGLRGSAFSQVAAIPADQWPDTIPLSKVTVVIFRPQVEAWGGNQIQVRAVVAIKPTGAAGPS